MTPMERTRVPSKIISIISLMNTTEEEKKKEPPPTWIQAHTLYSDWGEDTSWTCYKVNNYEGLLFLAQYIRYVVIVA